MTIREQIDFFFAPPLPMQSGESLSTLHLNRREVQDCLIAAGIDLLAKFYAGSDRSGKEAEHHPVRQAVRLYRATVRADVCRRALLRLPQPDAPLVHCAEHALSDQPDQRSAIRSDLETIPAG